jgi:hypothetical protein
MQESPFSPKPSFADLIRPPVNDPPTGCPSLGDRKKRSDEDQYLRDLHEGP